MWVFGYGSLLWNPGFEYAQSQLATLSGYHRCFCMRSIHHRGTPCLFLFLEILVCDVSTASILVVFTLDNELSSPPGAINEDNDEDEISSKPSTISPASAALALFSSSGIQFDSCTTRQSRLTAASIRLKQASCSDKIANCSSFIRNKNRYT